MIILQEQLDQPVVRAMAENPLPALELEDIFESDDSNSDNDSDSGNDSEDNERPPCQHQHNQPAAGHLPQYTLIAVPNSELRNLQQSGITYETLLNTLIFFYGVATYLLLDYSAGGGCSAVTGWDSAQLLGHCGPATPGLLSRGHRHQTSAQH